MPRNAACKQLLCVCALLIAIGTPAFGTTVLLIGNSHLAWNDLPAKLSGLANAGGHIILVASCSTLTLSLAPCRSKAHTPAPVIRPLLLRTSFMTSSGPPVEFIGPMARGQDDSNR